MSTRDDSDPPASPIPPTETIEEQVGRYRRAQQSLVPRVERLEAAIGSAPNPRTGEEAKPGTIWWALAKIETKVDALAEAFEADRKARERERDAHAAVEAAIAKRAEPVSRLWWIVIAATVGPTMAAIVAGLIYLLTRAIK